MSDPEHAAGPRRLPKRARVSQLVAEACGSAPDDWSPIHEGGYSPAARWVVRWRDGRSAFVKADFRSDHPMSPALERLVYEECSATCLPRLVGYAEGEPVG